MVISIYLLIYIGKTALYIIGRFIYYYSNLSSILRKFIICLSVIILVVCSSILYFNAALSEISIKSLVTQSNIIRDDIFISFISP